MGSKARYAKEFLPIILKNRGDQTYVEPFVGGCNVIDKVTGPRISGDNNRYLIALWKGLQAGLSGIASIDRATYNAARDQYNRGLTSMSEFEVGYIGWMASYNGRFFDGGYSGGYEKRDYIGEQIRNVRNQIPFIQGVDFHHCDYTELPIPANSVIYCDPPYKETKGYSTSSGFDHDKFWEWCRIMRRNGHDIFISEYEAPDDFTVVWEKEIGRTMHNTRTIRRTERLFNLK